MSRSLRFGLGLWIVAGYWAQALEPFTGRTAAKGAFHGRDEPLAGPDFKVVFWYDRTRPADPLRHQAYDLRKGAYTPAVDAWVRESATKWPNLVVRVVEVRLSREPGRSERDELDAAIARERLRLSARAADVEQPVPWTGGMLMPRHANVRSGRRQGGTIVPVGLRLEQREAWTPVAQDGEFVQWTDGKWSSLKDFVALAEAPAYFAEKARVEPANADWHGLRGLAHLELAGGTPRWHFGPSSVIKGSDADAALAHLTRAYELDAKEWYIYLFYCLRNREEDDDALLLSHAYIAKYPEDSNGYSTRASAWGARSEWKKAIEDITLAIAKAPDHAHHYYNRSQYYRVLEEYKQAVSDLTEAIRLSEPESNFDVLRQSLIDRAGLYGGKLGELRLAIADYSRLIELVPNGPQYRSYRGWVYWRKLKDHPKALIDFKTCLELAPEAKADGVMVNLANLLATSPDAACRDGALALRWAQKSLAVREAPEARAALAAAYAELGDFARAVAEQHKVLADERLAEKDKPGMEARLAAYQEGKPFRDPGDE
jgi:tetratricopeptide (TPR) repeat protein